MINNNLSYRTIFTSLRPQKIVTLIDLDDDSWMDSSMRIIEYYSQLWGGNYNLIIPTDGKKIDDIFLKILKEYDPDYIYKYSKSLLDLKYINNKEYIEKMSIDIEKAKKATPGIDEFRLAEWVEENAGISEYKELIISEELKQKLLEELNPLYERDDFIISHSIGAEQRPSYPLTNIIEIFKSSGLEKIIDFKINDSKVLQLLSYSIVGSAKYVKIINKDNQKERFKTKNLFEITSEAFEEKIIERENIDGFLDFIYQNRYSSQYEKMEKILKYTPFELTMKNLVNLQLIDQRRPEIKDTAVIVVGDKLEDFCLYYNLMKLKKDAIWLPYNLIKQEGLLDDYLVKMYIAISGKSRKMNDKKDIVFTSTTLNLNEIENVLKICKEYDIGIDEGKILISKDLDKLMPYMNYVYEKDNYTNINVEPFLGNESINLINIPLPKSSNFNIQNINPLEFRWITDVKIGTKKSGNLDRGYLLPLKKIFSNYLFDKRVYSTYTRVSKDGVSLCGPYYTPFAQGDSITNVVNINRPRIKVLDDYDVFKIMFEDIGYSIDLSDKGKYLLESLLKVDSLEELSKIFLDEKQFNLLKKFIDKKDVTESNYIIDNRLYIDFETIKEIFGEDTESFIDSYIKRNILYRGFIFKCSRCDNTDWYEISEIDNNFKCRRCSNVQPYLKNNWKLKNSPNEPKWFYKLDEVFYQGLDNDMYVTVLTLNKLQKNSERSFIYIPEIVLVEKENKERLQKMEIDICCLCDGEIIIGECKKTEKLENTEKKEKAILKSLANIFLKLKADKCLFSTYSSDWRDKTIELIDIFFNKYKLIYNNNDLHN